jgi:hypothetical protein
MVMGLRLGGTVKEEIAENRKVQEDVTGRKKLKKIEYKMEMVERMYS